MGKSTPAPPAPPDPYRTASAQTGSNIQSAIANATIGNADTFGPMGSTTFNRIGSESITGPDGQTYQVPRYSSNTTLSPEQQQLYNQQTQLGGKLNNLALNQTNKLTGLLDTPLDTSSLPKLTTDFSGDRKAVEQALFDRINPQLDRSRAQLETNLVNQGFQRGTEGFTTAMDQANREANDARLAITAQGLNEQQGLYGMNADAYSRGLQGLLAQRNQPINEITALMSGGQVSLPNSPAYNAPQVANTDVSGNVYNTAALQNQQWQTQQQVAAQKQAALFGALGGLGGAGLYGLSSGKLGGLFGK